MEGQREVEKRLWSPAKSSIRGSLLDRFSSPSHLTPCLWSQATGPRTPLLPAVNSSVLEPAEGTRSSTPSPPHTPGSSPTSGSPCQLGGEFHPPTSTTFHAGLFHISLSGTSALPNRVWLLLCKIKGLIEMLCFVLFF